METKGCTEEYMKQYVLIKKAVQFAKKVILQIISYAKSLLCSFDAPAAPKHCHHYPLHQFYFLHSQ